MHVLVEESLKPVGRLIVRGLTGIVNPSIVAYATHVSSKDIQCEVVIFLLQTLLHEGQVHWILHKSPQQLNDTGTRATLIYSVISICCRVGRAALTT